MKHKFLFLFLLSFLVLNTVSAIDATLLQTYNLPATRGTAGLIWDTNGNNLIAFDDCTSGGTANNATVYYTPSAYGINSLSISQTYNLTLLFPNNTLKAYTSNYSISNTTQNWNINTAYITRNGLHMYLLVTNEGCSWKDTNGIHSNSYAVLHYNLTSSFNISSAVYSDMLYYYGGELGGGFSQFHGTYGTTYTIPQIRGLYVNDAGTYLTISGNWYNSTLANLYPTFYSYSLTNAYGLNGALNLSSYERAVASNYTNPFNFSRETASNYVFYSNLQVTPDNSLVSLIERNRHSSSSTVSVSVDSVSNGMKQDLITSSSDYAGLTLASSYTNVYLFTQSLGVLYKYELSNITTQLSEAEQQTQTQQVYNDVIDSFTSVFPEPNTLSFKQKIGWVTATMFFTAIFVLVIGSNMGKSGVNPLLLWIILILLVVEFFFFISLGYIGTGVLVTLVLLALAVAYFMFKGNG